MQLTPNFSLSELTKSDTAIRKGFDNTPSELVIANLKALAVNILQPVRDYYGQAVIVRSGYRSLEVNTDIGSSPSSQHITGQAADFEIMGVSNIALCWWIKRNLEFDQLLSEFNSLDDINAGWVHCSYRADGKNRLTAGTYTRANGYTDGLPALH